MFTLRLPPTHPTTRLWPLSLTSLSRLGTTPFDPSARLPTTCSWLSTSSPQPTFPKTPTSSAGHLQNLSAMPSRSLSSPLDTSNQIRRRGSPPPPLSSLSPPTTSRSSVSLSGSSPSPGELSLLTLATSSPSVGAAGCTAILPVFAMPP